MKNTLEAGDRQMADSKEEMEGKAVLSATLGAKSKDGGASEGVYCRWGEGEWRDKGGSKVTLIFYPLLLRVTFWITTLCVSACVCVNERERERH